MIKIRIAFLTLVSVVFFSAMSVQTSYAGLNLLGGGSSGFNSSGDDRSVLLGGELTLNVFSVVEAGLFYDHNLAGSSSFNLAGATARIGFGPLFGLFFDAKVGMSPANLGVGAGAGIGYRFNSTLGLRAGPRLIAGPLGNQLVGDAALMICL